MQLKKFLPIFCLLFCLTLSEAQRRRKGKGGRGGNSCHLKDVEKCLDPLSALGKGANPTAIIATSEGLDKFCETLKKGFNGCIRDYVKKCGTPLHKEVVGMVMDQIMSHTNDICKKGPKREKFLKSSPCLHEKVLSQKSVKEDCNNRYLATLQKVSSNQKEDSLSGICCGYRYWEECTAKVATSECGESGLEAFHFLITKGFMDFPNLTCPKDLFVSNSDQCKAIIAPKGTKVKATTGETGIGKYNVANMFSFMFHV